MKATEITAGLAESNGSLLPGLWRDSLHVTCPVFSTGSIRHSQNDHLANSTNSQKNLHRLFHYNRIAHTHTHPFNGSFSGTTRVSRYQEGTTNLDFTEATDVSGSGISWAACKSAPRSRQLTTPTPHRSIFYRPDALAVAQPTASKH